MKKSKKKIIKIIIAVLILGIAGYFLFGKKEDAHIVIKTTKLSAKDITNSVTATGTLQPVDTVEVGTQVSGLVKHIFVDYNSQVHKGELLAELDKTNLQESVNNAKAIYKSAQNDASFYQQAYDRAKNMYNAQVISKADYEQAEYQLKNAKTTVTQSKIALTQAQTNLGYANIYSPIDGVILSKKVEEGQTVAAAMSTPTLFTIAKDITKMQVEADVDEADIGNVKEGQRVTFTVDAFPNEVFNGKVKQVRLAAVTTSNVVTYTVIINVDNQEQKLKPGLTATVTIFTQELKGVPGLEAAAFTFKPDEQLVQKYYKQNEIQANLPKTEKPAGKSKSVWVKNADGSLAQKTVTTGMSDGIEVEVLKGLDSTEQVIISMEEISTDGPNKAGDSPFMPKPPGKKDKKSKK